MRKKSRLMRVPNNFYNRIKIISRERRLPMSEVLKDSERIIANAQYLSNLIYRKAKKRR